MISISISSFNSEDLIFQINFNSISFENTLLPYLGFIKINETDENKKGLYIYWYYFVWYAYS